MHYYSFNIADYRKDTVHLSPIEHYIYRSLIDTYYLDGKGIDNNLDNILRLLRLDSTHVSDLKNVLSDFFKLSKKRWVHARIESDLLSYSEKCNKNKEIAIAREEAKRTRNSTKRVRDVHEIAPNHKPITNNHKRSKDILSYLNKKAGKNFKPVPANIDLINARLKEGHSEKEIKQVIDCKVATWRQDPKMAGYLRPATLFNATKFNSYVGEKPSTDTFGDAQPSDFEDFTPPSEIGHIDQWTD